METKRSTKEILADMHKLLSEAGWCRWEYEMNGRYCMLGAYNMATAGKPRIDDKHDESCVTCGSNIAEHPALEALLRVRNQQIDRDTEAVTVALLNDLLETEHEALKWIEEAMNATE